MVGMNKGWAEPDEARFKSILDGGLIFSAMLRNFRPGSKRILLEEENLPSTVRKILKCNTQESFDKIHLEFCRWGIRNIIQTHNNENASYGQIAKTLNVVLKVVVYYSHCPDCQTAKKLSKFLHAAVDNKMMKMLRRTCHKDFAPRPWPGTIAQVDKQAYETIRDIVAKFIEEERDGDRITPVQFDDIYWLRLNRTDRK